MHVLFKAGCCWIFLRFVCKLTNNSHVKSFKQQLRGPIQNIIVAVSSTQKYQGKTDKKSTIINLDDKVEAYFRCCWSKYGRALPYVGIKKRINMQKNCTVEITCQEFRKIISCSEELVEVQLETEISCNSNIYTGDLDLWQYIFEVNITVHEMSFSVPKELYEDTEFTDFQLKAADGAVAVHKAILAFHSDMFKTMLKGEWKETVEGSIDMEGVTVESVKHLKDYMYLGTLPEEGLEQLILLADHYLMGKLKSACIAKLVKSVKPENFDQIIKFACQSGISEELVAALIFGIPDSIANSVYQLKNKKTESNDEE